MKIKCTQIFMFHSVKQLEHTIHKIIQGLLWHRARKQIGFF